MPPKLHPALKNTLITLSWLPVVYTFTSHVYLPCQITGMSMAPTFNPGTLSLDKDIVVIQRYALKKPNCLQRGDVVMFRSPLNPEKLLTKRVVGLQGDVIMAKSPPYPRDQARIPRNHLWLEGDNAFHSVDSNTFGPVSQGLVVGKVVAVIWPPSRFGTDISQGGRDPRKPNTQDITVQLINDL